jgi:hypothetical protein
MSTESVQSAIVGQIDRLTQWRLACQDVVSVGGGTLWTRADAAADVDYENDVKGTNLAAVDSQISDMDAGAVVGDWFVKHNDYLAGESAYGNLAGYLAARRFRAHEGFGDLFYNKYGSRLSQATLFPKQARTIGTWLDDSSTDVYSPVATPIASNVTGPCIVEAYVDAVNSPGAVLSITLPVQANTPTKVLGLTLTSAGVGSVFPVGTQDLVSTVAVGDTTLGVDSTGQFTEGDRVLVVESDKTEVVLVKSITANQYLECTSPMVNSFSASGDVFPMFYNVLSAAAASGSSDTDKVTFRPRLDRTAGW